MKLMIRDIDWDTDGEPVNWLPECVIMETESEEHLVDDISDRFGFCIKSLGITILPENTVSCLRMSR